MRKHLLKLLALLPLLPFVVGAHAQDWAKARLDASPRHREYVTLHRNGRAIQAFVVYPEVRQKVPVVILVHEIFGLTDWAKEMADEIAAQGFIVVAPDLLSGHGPDGGGTSAYPSQDAVIQAISGLDSNEVNADLDAAADYAKSIPSANGKIAVVGFCWGGGAAFAFAAHRRDLSAAFVFYGPPPSDLAAIAAPVYGFYAGDDERITVTVPGTVEAMKAAHKIYEPVIYKGAGHGFMRAGEAPGASAANRKAREEGFARLIALLRKM